MTARIVSLLVCVALLSACSHEDPNSPVYKRKQVFFKQMLHTSQEMRDMLRGESDWKADKFSADAEQLQILRISLAVVYRAGQRRQQDGRQSGRHQPEPRRLRPRRQKSARRRGPAQTKSRHPRPRANPPRFRRRRKPLHRMP